MNMKKHITILLVILVGILACNEENKSCCPTSEEEKTMTLASTTIVEFRQFDGRTTQDLSSDKVKEYWGNRITDNTPTELQFKKDSLYIVKPNLRVEKYKSTWRGEELYLYNDTSESWRYCGVKTKDNGFVLNMGFYAIDSKNEKRTLRLVGQDYSLRNHSQVGDFGSGSIVWTNVNFLFKNK